MSTREIDRTPALLVTVIDHLEADLALSTGADVLDVKDPGRGALGAAPLEALAAIVARRDAWRRSGGSRRPVSVALGDRADLPDLPRLAAESARAGADILKVGLLGIVDPIEARSSLAPIVAAARAANRAVRLVAAGFADLAHTVSLPAGLLAGVAAAAGADGCLIDTARKDGRSLLQHLDLKALGAIVRETRRQGLFIALAGSLRTSDLRALRDLRPDFIGVRGAVCRGGRVGPLDAQRLAGFLGALRGAGSGEAFPGTPERHPTERPTGR
ncbi:MAG TPA: (5-formylfuran-3-yl)methyl phosphate synthase [Candidatus Polarisedimenticolia bacterium]